MMRHNAVLSAILLLITNSASHGTHKHAPTVTVSEGTLQGSRETLLGGASYLSFKGIPYGRPPVGALRFKAPLPALPWQGIRNATSHGSVCTQYDTSIERIIEGSEDCLFLNVYTKNLRPIANAAVMVYIHGGSYMSGSGDSDTYGPEFLFLRDVVLVTLNYRLEVLGFLSLDTPDVPGNAGMKDQALALRWIKRNIAKFGGDPDNITIFGESSGASSVTYHMLSLMSRGLFNKVIAQSGNSIQPWALGQDSRERAFRLGKHLGKDTKDVNELTEFLRSLPAVELTNVTLATLTEDERLRSLPETFTPVVEKTFRGVQAFLNEEPIKLLLEQKVASVPLMSGYNSAESLAFMSNTLKMATFLTNHTQYLVPRDIAKRLSQKNTQEFGNRIKSFYFGDKDISNDTVQAISDYQTDVNMLYNTHRFLDFYSFINSPVYMYRFDLVSDLNAVKIDLGYTNFTGAAHADDLFYLFYNDYNKAVYKKNPEARDMVFKLVKLWTDFAQSGNPTPAMTSQTTWLPYTRSGKEYLDISSPYKMGLYSERRRTEFWDSLYCEAGLPCMKSFRGV